MAIRQLKSQVKSLCASFVGRGKKPSTDRDDDLPPAEQTPAATHGAVKGPHTGAVPGPPKFKRFLGDQPLNSAAYVRAAKEYVGHLEVVHRDYLYEKPFDRLAGRVTASVDVNGSFYTELYQVMNLLRAMEIPFGGRILEVGSGPGWVSEMFMCLGYEVDGIEPCEDMIRTAEDRIAGCIQHHRLKEPPRVTFHCQTLEDCSLPDNTFDAVFFHASLHHVIDEEKGLAQCFRMLKPGGVLGVCESAWLPGNRGLEDILEQEMARAGTMENPFTREYLDYLLNKHGFLDVVRYHSVNGLFPRDVQHKTVREVAQFSADDSNTLTARKPDPTRYSGPTTANPTALTLAEITLLEARVEESSDKAYLKVKLVNRGHAAWLHKICQQGCVGLGLCQGRLDTPLRREAEPRYPMPRMVLPGEEIVVEPVYYLPKDWRLQPWHLDLASEFLFWFSTRGTTIVPVTFTLGKGS